LLVDGLQKCPQEKNTKLSRIFQPDKSCSTVDLSHVFQCASTSLKINGESFSDSIELVWLFQCGVMKSRGGRWFFKHLKKDTHHCSCLELQVQQRRKKTEPIFATLLPQELICGRQNKDVTQLAQKATFVPRCNDAHLVHEGDHGGDHDAGVSWTQVRYELHCI